MLKQKDNNITSPLLSIWSRNECLDIASLLSDSKFKESSVIAEILTINPAIKIPLNVLSNMNNGYFHFIFNAYFSIIKGACGNFIDFLPHPYAYFRAFKPDINIKDFSKNILDFPMEDMKISVDMIFFDLDNVVDRTPLPNTSNPGVIPGIIQSKIAHLHDNSYSPLNEFKFKLKNENF